jgi:hypothetical protein
MHRSTRSTVATTLAFSAALLVSGCSSGSTGSSAAAAPTTSAATPGGGASAGNTAAATTGSTPTATDSATGGASGSCRNLQATAAVKTAVTTAYEAKFTNLNHIAPVPGSFYYGSCGGATYAVTNFMPTAGAGIDVEVALQDDGSARKYFSYSSATGWSYIASGAFPDRGGCASQIPSQLAAAWSNCPATH